MHQLQIASIRLGSEADARHKKSQVTLKVQKRTKASLLFNLDQEPPRGRWEALTSPWPFRLLPINYSPRYLQTPIWMRRLQDANTPLNLLHQNPTMPSILLRPHGDLRDGQAQMPLRRAILPHRSRHNIARPRLLSRPVQALLVPCLIPPPAHLR